MLYFSKLRIISVIVFTVIFSYFAFSNFVKFDDKFFSKNINLGLDLQGGSYLLLEIDNRPVITQKLQAKIIELKRFFKEKQITLKNFSLKGDTISFETTDNEIENVKNILNDKESDVNTYYPTYKSHEFDVLENGSLFSLNYSKYGLVLLKNSSLDQAIEIVRRRVDEVGTNEPNILNDKESDVNTYYPTYKSHEFDVLEDGNLFSLNYSRYGLVLLKNSSLDQAIEIVRRRVDEVGTNEPNILSLPLFRIFGSFVPISSTLLLTISIA